MKNNHLLVASAFVFLSVSSTAGAAIIASSTFNSGSDDWATLSTDLTWQSSGGDLNSGYIQFNNNLGSNAIIHAPSNYLGDWASMGVNEITYQANIFQTGNFVRQQPYQVGISGPGGEAIWNGPAAEPGTLWKSLNVSVVEAEWDITSGTWDSILADVTDFNIIMAYYTNTSPFEITGLDNVSLNAIPLPASLWLFGSGLISVISIAQRKNTKRS